MLTANPLKQFYYKNYDKITAPTTTWNKTTQTTNQVTGYFKDANGDATSVGSNTTNNLKYATVGSLLKFEPTAGSHFMPKSGTQMTGAGGHPGSAGVIWCKPSTITLDGSNGGTGNLADGTGPIILNDLVPTDARLTEIIPAFVDSVDETLKNSIISNVTDYKNFGLSYNVDDQKWNVVTSDNLGSGEFDLSFQGDTTEANKDNSWLLKFTTNGVSYTVTYRVTEYIFESKTRNKFYFDPNAKIVDPETGFTIKDKIRITKSNVGPDFVSSLVYDYDWAIVGNVTGDDGYNDTRKIKVGFFDSDDDGIIDNPDLFTTIVAPDTSLSDKYVFFQTATVEGFDQLNVVDQTTFVVNEKLSDITDFSVYTDDQLFYFYDTDTFLQYDSATDTTSSVSGYTAKLGRQDLIYNYNHGASRSRRIDPGVSNLVDIYVMTKSYNTALRTWLANSQATTRPVAPTIFNLEDQYLSSLDKVKSVSDEIIFNP